MNDSPSPTYFFYNCNDNTNAPLPQHLADYANVDFELICPEFTLLSRAILDIGASNTVLPLQLVNDEYKQFIRPHRVKKITGVGGDSQVLGSFYGQFKLGDMVLDDVTVLVVEPQDMPCLIGQNVLRHSAFSSWLMNLDKGVVEFNMRTGQTHTVPLLKKFKVNSIWKINSNEQSSPVHPPNPGRPNEIEFLRDKHGVDLSHLSGDELNQASSLLYKYEHLFGDGESNMGCLRGGVASLHTEGESINIPPRRVSPYLKDKIQEEIDRMLKMGVIIPCEDNLGWNSPVMPVKKPDGRIRITVDFKQSLNRRLTRPEPFPQPAIDEIFESIPPRVKFFSSVDLQYGYWQVVIREQDRPKTAFFWGDKNYMFTRLPMGLTTSGNIFSREVARVLSTIKCHDRVVKYLDDLSVMAETFDEHFEAVESLLKALDDANLRLKPAKCRFFASEIKFLGRLVSEKGYRPDPEYVEGVNAIDAPSSTKELLDLQGRLTWLRLWIGNQLGDKVAATSFSQLMGPIFDCGKEKPFKWSKMADNALGRIRKRLKCAPYISYADPSQPFILTTDASDRSASGCLMQKIGDRYGVIGNHSKTFDQCQRRWSTIEREAFAILSSVRKFDYFLRNKPFTIHTDHRPLVFLDRTNINNPKIRRWQEELSNYQFTVEHVAGKDNVMADWLSRPNAKVKSSEIGPPELRGEFYKINDSSLTVYIPSWCKALVPDGKVTGCIELEPVAEQMANYTAVFAQKCAADKVETRQYLDLYQAQISDSTVRDFITALEKVKSDVDELDVRVRDDFGKALFTSRDKLTVDAGTRLLVIENGGVGQIVVPPSYIGKLVKLAHSSAHLGVKRTLEFLKEYWWPDKSDDVAAFVASCDACLRKKGRYGNKQPRAGTTLKGTSPFQVIYLDYINLPSVRGFKYAMTLQCSLTRWIEVYPSQTNTAKDTAKFLCKFILKHGELPEIISSDRGTHFANSTMEQFCKQLGIDQKLHCSWRPQSSGGIERMHRTLKSSLFTAAYENSNTWLDNLEMVQSILNSCVNESTKCSPFFAIRGKDWKLPAMPNISLENSDRVENLGYTLTKRLNQCHRAIVKISEAADEKRRMEKNVRFDSSQLQPGDQVLVYRPVSAEARELNMPWTGPYTVIIANDLTAKLRNNYNSTEDYVSRHHIKLVPPKPKFMIGDEEEDLAVECLPSGGGETVKEVPIKTENSPAPESSKYQPITLNAAPEAKVKFKEWVDARNRQKKKRKKDSHNLSSGSVLSVSGKRRDQRPTKKSRLENVDSGGNVQTTAPELNVRKSTRDKKTTEILQIDGRKKTYK